jgi:AraC family transcriptional regulator
MSALVRSESLGGPGWAGPRLARCTIPASGVRPLRVTDGDRIVFCEHGSATVELEGADHRRWKRHAGTFDLIPARRDGGTLHWSGAGLRVVSMVFPQDQWRDIPLQLGLQDQHVADLCQRLIRQAELGQPFGSAYVSALTLTLSTYLEGLLERRADPGEVRPPRLSNADRMRIERYVQEHIARELSIKELAELAGYSLDHFAKLFKNTFGVPPHRYLLDCRVNAAREHLAAGSLPLAEIAWRCGFGTQAHFTGIFKLRTGVAPGEYRRRLGNEQAADPDRH